VTVSAGGRHTVALKSDGSLAAWGENDFGQLGIGTTLPQNSPTPLDTTPPSLSITSGPVFYSNASTLTVSGNVEPGAQVTVTISTDATVGAVSISGTGGSDWSNTIINLVPGVNTITVTAADSSGNKTVQTAIITYDLNPFVQRASDTMTGAAIQPLYDGIPLTATDTLKIRAVTLTESPVFERTGVSLNLHGGYDIGFGSAAGATTIKGTMTIRQGTVKVRNLIIN